MGAERVYSVFDFIAFVGLAVFVIAIVALIKGRLSWARIASRKIAVGVLVGGFAMFTAGAALAAPPTQSNAQAVAAPASTTNVQPATIAVQTTEADAATSTAVVTTTTTSQPPITTTTTVTPRTTTTHVTKKAAAPRTVHTTTHTTTKPKPVAPVSHLTCAASVSNSSPADNSTVDVLVRTGGSATVTATAHYKTTDTTHSESVSGSSAEIAFRISRATPGYTVEVDVTVSGAGASRSCATSFTPVK